MRDYIEFDLHEHSARRRVTMADGVPWFISFGARSLSYRSAIYQLWLVMDIYIIAS